MRPLEIAVLLANLLAFVLLLLPLSRRMRRLRLLTLAVVLLAVAQVWVEGPRWQMIPAYALAGLWVWVWVWVWVWRAQAHTRRLAAGAAMGLGALGLVISSALPIVLPVFGFPHPGGPYAIGTLTYHWEDAGRREIFSGAVNEHRGLMVQVWYPASRGSSLPNAPYLQDASAVMAAFAHMHHLPAFIFGHLKYVTTNARVSVSVAGNRANYPVLLYLEGATGFRQMNGFQVEDLVSHGYIVAAIDQPGAAADVVFPDGHQVAGVNPAQLHAAISPSYLPGPHAPLPSGWGLKDSSIVPYLAQDVAFTLDRLAALNQADPSGILTGKLDMQRVGAFGMSLGGIVVGEACRQEPRLRACLMMDAPMPTRVVQAGLQQPSMWITRDAATMRLERQQTGGWPEAEILAHQATMRAVYLGLPGAGYFVQVPGMFHSNFTDIPGWSPVVSWIGLAGPIDTRKAYGIVNAYSLAFFDRHLSGHPATLLHGPAHDDPDVLFESRRP